MKYISLFSPYFRTAPMLRIVTCLVFVGCLGLWGCPKSVQRDNHLFCREGQGFRCLTKAHLQTAQTPPTATLPLYDINGAPVTCWRFREKKQTVGMILTGQQHHPLVAALFHAFYFSMFAFTHEHDMLGDGYVAVMAPGGSQGSARYLQSLARWENLFRHLADAGWLQMRDVDAQQHHQLQETIRKDIQQFHRSALSRTILYYPAKSAQIPVLFLPTYTIHRDPYVVQATFPIELLAPARAEALGKIYYTQRYENSQHFVQALSAYYKKNLRKAEGLHALRFQCVHTWFNLFHLSDNKMQIRTLRISRTLQQIDNPKIRREEYCTPDNHTEFRRSKTVHAQIRDYRKQLDLLNETFQDMLDAYDKGQQHVNTVQELNISTFLDAFLRGHLLYYTDPIRVDGKLVYPQVLMETWMKESRARIWRSLHKDFQKKGHHLQDPGMLGGSLHQPYTLFRVRKSGSDYLVRSYQLIGGSFAILLDRARGIVEVISPHQTSTTSGADASKVVPHAAAESSSKTTIPTASAKASDNSKVPTASAKASVKLPGTSVPLLTTEEPFYTRIGAQQQEHLDTLRPWSWRTSRRQTRSHALYVMLHRPCPKNVPITPIRHHSVQELPSELPELPERSFRVHEGFFWMRWTCLLLTIPIQGITAMSSLQLQGVAQQVEQAMLERNAIPARLVVKSLQPVSIQLDFRGSQ